jgi:hypothetical protein
MLDKIKYLWHFMPFGDFLRDKRYRTEHLYAHQMISQSSLAQVYDREKVLETERRIHREAVAAKVVEAMYEGWMPFEMEWWEGPYDDYHILKGYPSETGEDYHFWTKVRLASWDYLVASRASYDEGKAFARHTPRNLS